MICARYSPAPMRTMRSSISPKFPVAMRAAGVGRELPHRLDIGREPGQAVGGALLAVERTRARRGRRCVTVRGDRPARSANSASTASIAWLSVAISS